VELIVIGAGPAYTSRRGAAGSSYLLRSGAETLLLDLGHGAFSNLASEMEPSSLEGILVSHLHPDHFVDLVPLRHYLKWEFDPPRRATVLGPAGLADRLDALDGNPDFAAASLDINELSEGVQRFGPFEVEARRVAHTGDSYAFRVSAGPNGSGSAEDGAGPSAGLVYSGDCSNAEDLLPLIHPGDTLLSEASFGAGPIAAGAQHITSADAGRVATTGGATRLLITHVLAGHPRDENLAAAQAEFTGQVQMVTEGDRFDV
jgi:ribonuclease BN (tRNA processing enzyme)